MDSAKSYGRNPTEPAELRCFGHPYRKTAVACLELALQLQQLAERRQPATKVLTSSWKLFPAALQGCKKARLRLVDGLARHYLSDLIVEIPTKVEA